MKRAILLVLTVLFMCLAVVGCTAPNATASQTDVQVDITQTPAAATEEVTPAVTEEAPKSDALALSEAALTREAQVDEYAGILAKAVQTQEGDRILINATPSLSDFANLVAEKCYKIGAQGVQVLYTDKAMINLHAKYLKDNEYNGYYFQFALFKRIQNTYPDHKTINIISQYFDEEQATTEEMSVFQTVAEAEIGALMQEHNLNTENPVAPADLPWVMAPYPTKSWAKKVYPELDTEAAYNKMLDDFLAFARIGSKEDFFEHSKQLMSLADKANELDIVELHYKSKTADLRVPLHPSNRFAGGQAETSQGTAFSSNIPTEEIYAMPTKHGANGTVSATRPFILRDQLVEGLKMTFQDGKLVDYSVTAGEDIMKQLVESSPEGVYLGESALVTNNSPIFQSNRIYYEMLLDENAGAHIALGNALRGFNLKQETEADKDVNEADYHIDIIIGSEDLNVTATLKDGSQMDLIRNGEWSF